MKKVALGVVLSTVILFWGGGCNSVKNTRESLQPDCNKSVLDLCSFPQNAEAYASNIKEKHELLPKQQPYVQDYYLPWRYAAVPKAAEEVVWPFSTYDAKDGYGENLRPLEQGWFDEMFRRSNFSDYGSLNRFALSLRFTSLRNFPTDKPYFNDPSKAGEGFPFDYLQNSAIHANEPLFVSHMSDDGAWVYVFTSYATGWIRSHELAYLSHLKAQFWQDHIHISLINDDFPVKDENGNFLFRGRIGIVLPLLEENEKYYTVMAASADGETKARFVSARIPKKYAVKKPLLFNGKNITLVGNELLKSKYGWGGLYEDRDCSSTMRDFFAPFGIWLPRNSSQQARVGKQISFEGLGNDEKIRLIKSEGVPFETLLYLKGHIVLYIGEYKDNIMILHNMWGVKTFTEAGEGRAVVGRTVISTLEIGKEIKGYDSSYSLLSRLKSMNIVTCEQCLIPGRKPGS